MDMNNFFNDLQGKINQAIESSPAKDIERNVKAMMTQGFSKLDLVTREEFDIQAQVLAKTRAKLDALELRVAELEAKLASAASDQKVRGLTQHEAAREPPQPEQGGTAQAHADDDAQHDADRIAQPGIVGHEDQDGSQRQLRHPDDAQRPQSRHIPPPPEPERHMEHRPAQQAEQQRHDGEGQQ